MKTPENTINNNISNIQTTATYSSHSTNLNDFSFLAANEDNNFPDQEENKLEKVSLDSFDIKGLIGRGSFGEVFLVEKKDTKVLYALKVLKKSLIMSYKFIYFSFYLKLQKKTTW